MRSAPAAEIPPPKFAAGWLGMSVAAMLAACNVTPVEPADAGRSVTAPATAMRAAVTRADADAAVVPRSFVPYIAGSSVRVYAPPGTRYVNDHTLARGDDGNWHLYGITHESLGAPQSEHVFLHARAASLRGPWITEPDILVADVAMNESVLWAPHVAPSSPGHWVMHYWAGSRTAARTPSRPRRSAHARTRADAGAIPPLPSLPAERGLRRADSTDLVTWTRAERTPLPAQRPPGGRDPFLLHIGTRWLLYSVSVAPTAAGPGLAYGQIVVTETNDLTHPSRWSEPTPALEDPLPDFWWGNCESPFVVAYAGQYYLFITRTSRQSHQDYTRTLVFRSPDPTRFVWRPITELPAHAAEIVEDGGRWFITSAGWTSAIGEAHRGLSLAPLGWAPDPG